MNNIILIGRVATNIELRISEKTTYTRFNLAVKRQGKKDTADFIPCVAFGKKAETIKEYIKKGNKIAIQGQLLMSEYEVKGEKKKTFDVYVESMEFLEPKKKEEGGTDERIKGTLLEPPKDDDAFPF